MVVYMTCGSLVPRPFPAVQCSLHATLQPVRCLGEGMIVKLLAIFMLHNRKIVFYKHNNIIMHVYITYTCREPYHGSLKAAYEPFNESPKVR